MDTGGRVPEIWRIGCGFQAAFAKTKGIIQAAQVGAFLCGHKEMAQVYYSKHKLHILDLAVLVSWSFDSFCLALVENCSSSVSCFKCHRNSVMQNFVEQLCPEFWELIILILYLHLPSSGSWWSQWVSSHGQLITVLFVMKEVKI